jgi:hypothetical protein
MELGASAGDSMGIPDMHFKDTAILSVAETAVRRLYAIRH